MSPANFDARPKGVHPWLLIALVCSWVPTPGSPEIFTSCSFRLCRGPSDGSRDVVWVPHFCAAAESYVNNFWRLISASPLRRCCTARRTCCSTSAPSSKHGHTGLRCRAWPGLRSTPQPWTRLDWAAAGGHRSGHRGGPHAQDRLRPSNGAGCGRRQAAPAAWGGRLAQGLRLLTAQGLRLLMAVRAVKARRQS